MSEYNLRNKLLKIRTNLHNKYSPARIKALLHYNESLFINPLKKNNKHRLSPLQNDEKTPVISSSRRRARSSRLRFSSAWKKKHLKKHPPPTRVLFWMVCRMVFMGFDGF